MARVTRTVDADTVRLRWGSDGTEHVIREGDESAGGRAFIKCVAEGLLLGDTIEGDAEQAVAKALLEDAVSLCWLPATGTLIAPVDKAGRVLSGTNLLALQNIHDAVGSLIASELQRRNAGETAPEDGADPESPEEDKKEPPNADDAKKNLDDTLDYIVAKSDGDQMYTFGPLYAPDRKDAHGEYTDAETLQKAVHDYVQACVDSGSNELNMQHDIDGIQKAGRWVEVCAWPYETTVKLRVPGEDERSVTLPANTIFMGIQWDAKVWKDVKAGNIAGLSLGGKAMRVVTEGKLDLMGDKLAAVGPHKFQASADDPSVCSVCGETDSGGMHY